MSTMHTSPPPLVPDKILCQESPLSPEWIHAITPPPPPPPPPPHKGLPLSSEPGKYIQKWILYHAIHDPTDFWLTWDPTDPDDIRLLQNYVESNGSVVYLPSSTVKNLISLWNSFNLLINKERPADQKCNVPYFVLDGQWFNLTSSDMETALVNAGLEYHGSQATPGTSMSNFSSSPSPASMRCTIHLELAPQKKGIKSDDPPQNVDRSHLIDPTRTTTNLDETYPLDTSYDHLLH